MSTLKRIDEHHLSYETEKSGSYKIILDGQVMIESNQKNVQFSSDEKRNPIYEIHHDYGIEYKREQLMDKTGVVNFRDIGGYYTMDGRQVRHGQFYRSASLVQLQKQQKAYLDSLQIKTIFDLRSDMEVKGNEDYLPKGSIYVHASGIQAMEAAQSNDNFNISELMKQTDASILKGFIQKIYGELPIQNPAYHQLMKWIWEKQTPMVFHCSAGKDRTGFAAALILLTLGVDKETVIQDYLLSNELRKDANKEAIQIAGKKEGMDALLMVFPEYINLSFQKIDEVYGTFENYLLQEFGIDEEKREILKQRYLYE